MTSREQVREEIARVIDKALNGDCGYGVGEHLADVLLARFPVLAGVTDEMVEAGARAIDPAAWDESAWLINGRAGVVPDAPGARAARDLARGHARELLEAVLGSRDADAPGAGSTDHDRDAVRGAGRVVRCDMCGGSDGCV